MDRNSVIGIVLSELSSLLTEFHATSAEERLALQHQQDSIAVVVKAR